MVAPAADDTPPALIFTSDISSFQPDLPSHRPRAWDRLPKSPHTKRRKGCKVWKRYERPQMSTRSEKHNHMEDGEFSSSTIEPNSAHAAKRLRAKDTPMDQEDEMKQKPSKYITTLRDKVLGTPRRKAAIRRSLRIDPAKNPVPPAVEKQDEGPAEKDLKNEEAQSDALEEEEIREIHLDPVQPAGGPLSEDVEEALSSPMSEKLVAEDLSPNEKPDTLVLDELNNRQNETEVVVGNQQPPEGYGKSNEAPSDFTPTRARQSASPIRTCLSEANKARVSAERVTPNGDAEDTPNLQPAHMDDERIVPQRPVNTANVSEAQDQLPSERETGEQGGETLVNDLPSGSTSPQQVRRSSRRLSEKNKQKAVDDEGAEPRPTCAITDTTEVREERSMDLMIGQEDTGSSSKDINQVGEVFTSEEVSEQGEHIIMAQMNDEVNNSEELDPSTDEHLTPRTMDNGTLKLSATETNRDEMKVAEPVNEVKTSPRKSTRSGTRFSDDTSMLKDFLSRAQARKQAKDAPIKANPLAGSTSPCGSPRKALANLDSNSSSPRKAHEVANRAGTPPGKVRLGEVRLDNIDETTGDPSPVRRSTRKRLPAPAKTATGAPSFIPVRRADGTDPVVLHKSVAQELALVTRTNTRRNKGQSKPPSIFLKTLGIQEVEEETKGGHALRSCKSVGWDKNLVYYQDGTEGKAEARVVVEEKRPKARRLRGLGTGNGTPAPKRMTADVLSSNGTPASKRHGHGRTRS
ncbi:MAG: hypothetical protein LQ343_005771 [Gyalolechia ehrenbergii]|nr:MAG: hypothetical protein LQ343_005771 [Gyalolechia ehrenbergii]